ncbi:hypothetical protein P7K49_006058 [Saguinus oedipus]|uniref:Uncharacterized protein n=1 Tax=Saguinus oedipus TaxID=9490 RepID=A0ABQ9W4W8_SAGOE|nr:hypothetical protein P7K49_006058 [Saguinus oedipus]
MAQRQLAHQPLPWGPQPQSMAGYQDSAAGSGGAEEVEAFTAIPTNKPLDSLSPQKSPSPREQAVSWPSKSDTPTAAAGGQAGKQTIFLLPLENPMSKVKSQECLKPRATAALSMALPSSGTANPLPTSPGPCAGPLGIPSRDTPLSPSTHQQPHQTH